MAHFGGPTDNPRRFSPSPALPGGGGWDLVGAHGENDTDEYDCESEMRHRQSQVHLVVPRKEAELLRFTICLKRFVGF
ncbi:hypothetical protein HRI_000820100 [Hibiscus trionum]|uniref:Uncharacterized protein n=1 Tax=Hibiscus trionum TaxID=183268 RepID=A0A9W7LNX9_HIBTR|nr:hypothetical protein HRI_000820100 [Hibiscus trionum]